MSHQSSWLPVSFHDSIADAEDSRTQSLFFVGYRGVQGVTQDVSTIQPNPGLYPYPTTEEQLFVSTNNAADYGTVIGISGLDSGYNVVQEALVLAPGSVGTAHSYFRVNRMVLITGPTSINTNVGTITALTGGGSTIAVIPPQHGASRNGVFTAPVDFSMKILSLSVHFANRTQSNQPSLQRPNILMSLRFNSGFPNNHWRKNIFVSCQLGREDVNFDVPIRLQPKSTAELQIESIVGDMQSSYTVAAYVQGFLERMD